jgi:hypothetical protein
MASVKEKIVEELDHELLVVENFAEYVRGQIITEAAKIKELLESEWANHVVKKAKPAPADPSAS